MSDYDNTNRGVLFKNNRKETDKHPDYTGHINIDGTEFWLSAWVQTSKSGDRYLSLSKGKEKEARNDGGSQESDVPFEV